MGKSIRWRLQFWYAVILTLVLGGFAGILFFEVRNARYRQLDADLIAASNYLDSSLRGWPPPELDPTLLPKFDRPPPPGMRPGPPRERLVAELIPPNWATSSGGAEQYYAVWRADGVPIKLAGVSEGYQPESAPPASRFGEVINRGQFREVTMIGPRNTRIIVGRSTTVVDAELRAFTWQLVLIGIAVLLVGLAGGWLISSRIVRPITKITAIASHISAENLSERIDIEEVDSELAELARVLNETFARLETAFAQLTRFTADASHELRTPLAVIRSHAELALSRPRSSDDYRQTVESCLTASKRMTEIVEGLLTLARADAGKLELKRETIDLSAIVREIIAQLSPLAEKRKITITPYLQTARTLGDSVALSRVVSNLIENAIRYNRDSGTLRVHLVVKDEFVVLTVADSGIGIPASDMPHVFERFFRVDKARSRASGGTGLGLAICKSIVESHGGTIECIANDPVGTTFRVRLPKCENETGQKNK